MLESLGRVGSLRRGILGLRETFGLSLALLALVMASSLATSSAAAFAGATVPLVYLTAGVGSLCLASVIIRFTRRMASAGGLYTFTARGLDCNAGFIGGWLYSWGFAAGISFVLIIASFFLSTVLTVHTSIDLSWFQCFWILVALLTVFALADIRLSTRTQLVFASLGGHASYESCRPVARRLTSFLVLYDYPVCPADPTALGVSFRPPSGATIAPAYVFRNAPLVRLEPGSWACWNGRFGDVPRIPAPVLQLYRSKHLERLPRLEAWAQLNLIKDVYPLQAAPAAPLTQDGTACGTTLSGPPAALTNPQG